MCMYIYISIYTVRGVGVGGFTRTPWMSTWAMLSFDVNTHALDFTTVGMQWMSTSAMLAHDVNTHAHSPNKSDCNGCRLEPCCHMMLIHILMISRKSGCNGCPLEPCWELMCIHMLTLHSKALAVLSRSHLVFLVRHASQYCLQAHQQAWTQL